MPVERHQKVGKSDWILKQIFILLKMGLIVQLFDPGVRCYKVLAFIGLSHLILFRRVYYY